MRSHPVSLRSIFSTTLTKPLLGLTALSLGALALTGCPRAPTQRAADNAATQTASQTATSDTTTASTNPNEILNVSYDVSRDLYKKYNDWFSQQYKTQHNTAISIKQSHGGSSKQALSVANGLPADVVTMNQGSDIAMLVKKGLIDPNWQTALPNQAVPYTTTMVLLVRKDNPKQIKDWNDLARDGVSVVIANPKTSGTARYGVLAAYGYALKHGDEKAAQQTLRQILSHVATYDSGARAATTTFAQRQIGDVLITTENEAHISQQQFANDGLQIVYPSYSVRINNPVAVVTAVTDKRGTTQLAHDYLAGLWSKPAQTLMAEEYLRPVDAEVLAKFRDRFPDIATFDANETFGDWDTIMDKYFKDGALFDQLANPASLASATK